MKTTQRLAAALFGLVLLLCQTLALARTCLEAPPPASAAAQDACHDENPDAAAHGGGHSDCASQASSFGQATVVLPAIAAPASFNVRLDVAGLVSSCSVATNAAAAQPPPVPLILLHCRLLN